MATTRQSIIRGPGTATFAGVKLFDATGISANLDSATQDVPSSISGKLDTIKTDQIGKVTLTPVGSITETILETLYPDFLRSPVIGQSLYGSTDKTLIISSRAGQKLTFLNAAITKAPDLILSPIKTAFGSMELTALLANGKLATDTNSLYTLAAATYTDGEPPRTGLTGCHYEGTFGSLTIPDTVDGWIVSIEAQYDPVTTDSQGTIDYTLAGVNVTAKCTPLGLSESQILSQLPILRGRGASMAGTNDLVIESSDGLIVTLKNATVVTGPLNWGTTSLRAGELGFTAHIDTTDGELFDVELAESDSDAS